MTRLNITLTERLKRQASQAATKKGYANASEYVRALIECDQHPDREALEDVLVKRVSQNDTIEIGNDDWRALESRIRSASGKRK